ncbi:uncharacterized protein EV422DRAFT_567777 [Fimicolochytrium jonesii]|uniref:uncharacterized protein n=1 Tax=Fimicolochytrium jonesii TaxID=1396493 RepID=UPI0022FEC645|nr:uncharacterized protein EV422DRAFT_567777 [Fimicolochytrium jonesii]KAI8820885.1 hypothetical protein EV422DRAFT_567777 [Fimicolochytrium jonesii]
MHATLAFLAPVLAAFVASGTFPAPAAPSPDAPAAAACTSIFKHKYNSAYECANAVSAVPSPKAAFFVWNSITKECFPKGTTPFNQENSQTLTIADQTSDQVSKDQEGLFATDAKLKTVCGDKFRIPYQWANEGTACSKICKANTFVDGCDFAITIAGHAGITQGQWLGARAKW